jgi:hypothetical protein
MSKVIIGFTASRVSKTLTLEGYVREVNRIVKKLEADGFVTGACWGGDEYIALAIKRFHPKAPHIVVIPAALRQVSGKAIETATQRIRMPPRSSYRARNAKIVELSTRMIAFWSEQRAHSGTFMTINMARRAGKIKGKDIHRV